MRRDTSNGTLHAVVLKWIVIGAGGRIRDSGPDVQAGRVRLHRGEYIAVRGQRHRHRERGRTRCDPDDAAAREARLAPDDLLGGLIHE
jgi:hypothetical protein